MNLMRRPQSPANFCLQAALFFLVLMVGWMQVSSWTSYPAAKVAQIVLDSQAEGWIESTQNVPGQLKAKSRFGQIQPDQRVSSPVAVVEPAHYAYGTILFMALLMAGRSRHIIRRFFVGFCLLLFPQAFSLVFVLLGQLLKVLPFELLEISVWQADAILLCNVFGMLVLPTLAPVAVWLWMEWGYFESLAPKMRHPGSAG